MAEAMLEDCEDLVLVKAPYKVWAHGMFKDP